MSNGTTAMPKLPCPKCDQGAKFVFWDNEKHRYFCWRNLAKEKFGCGHTWSPHERAQPLTAPPFAPPMQEQLPPPPSVPDPRFQHDPQKSVTRAAAPPGGRRCRVFLDSGQVLNRVLYKIDANNNLHLAADDVEEVMRYWSRIEFE